MSLSLEIRPTTIAFASHPAAILPYMAPFRELNFHFVMIPTQCCLVLCENQ
jgi:hypothetical protein